MERTDASSGESSRGERGGAELPAADGTASERLPRHMAPGRQTSGRPASESRRERPGDRPPTLGTTGLVLGGFLLPAMSIGVELTSRICTENFFDPLPTTGHVLFFGSIVAAAFLLLGGGPGSRLAFPRATAGMLGFALVAAGTYSLVFLPLAPISLIAVLMVLGLLSLSPFFALGALIGGLKRLRQATDLPARDLRRSLWVGAGLALLVLVVLEVPPILARKGLAWATDSDPMVRARGISLLRGLGGEDEILRACYVAPRRRRGLLDASAGRSRSLFAGLGDGQEAPTRQQARELYYRVTGRPFNSVPPPADVPRSIFDFDRDFSGWEEQGGDVVAGRIAGLGLATSRLDGSVDAQAALAYLEWTMEFENRGGVPQEARAELALPPGGTVSRLTLWVNGVEREAVFGPRTRVTQAYKDIVQRPRATRDPVLVRTSGPDRVLVQCFPVVPGHRRMKIRLGITAPVELDGSERGWIGTPSIVERNFDVPEQAIHAIWWESRSAIHGSGEPLVSEHTDEGAYAVRGTLTDGQLGRGRGALRIDGAGREAHAWTPDPTDPEAWRVVQRIRATASGGAATPAVLAIVVDGSRLMEDSIATVARFVEGLPPGIRLHVLVAREERPEVLAKDLLTGPGTTEAVAENLRDADARGGCDAVPALLDACAAAGGERGGLLLWVHGPQPVTLQPTSTLAQYLERRPPVASILVLQAVRGPNRLLDVLDRHGGVRTVGRRGDLGADLDRLLSTWQTGAPRLDVERRRVPIADFDASTAGRRVSRNLAKLWALDAVDELLRGGRRPDTEAAQQLATAHRVVVPVTAAVVLETDQQYLDAGLVPPTQDAESELLEMAEPELWLLLIAIVVLLLLTPRLPWPAVAAAAVTLAVAFALKLHFSDAGAEAFAWVLAPTAWLVDLATGAGFEWEPGVGYVSADALFAITKSCAGVNFLIAAFAMLALASARGTRGVAGVVRTTATAALIAYVATVGANSLRILVAMPLAHGGESVHRLVGVVVYFGALCILYALFVRPRKRVGWLVPLGFYLGITLAVPLVNAWLQGRSIAASEHALVLLTVPPAMLLFVLLLHAVHAPGGRRAPRGA